MAERRWGRVINVSSISSRVGTPGMTAYCASKWGLNGFTQALAAEVKGETCSWPQCSPAAWTPTC